MSWHVMSRKMPPDTARYGIGGGAGSRLEMRTRCSAPTVPAATESRTNRWAGSKRRLKPTCSRAPASATAANARSTSARSSDSGFSQKIALPDDAAATSISTCVSVLVQMATASISSLASTSSTDSATGTPSDPATALAATGSTSYTTPSAAPSTWWASSSACIRPMRPTPRTPTRTVSVATPIAHGVPGSRA